MKHIFFILIYPIMWLNLSATNIKSEDFDNHFKLLPKPQKLEFLPGNTLSFNDLRFIFLDGISNRPVLVPPLSSLPLADNHGKGVLTLKLSDNDSLPISKEGYVLLIRDKEVTITSKGEAGLFYGCQTLLQLLEDAHDQQIDIPSCRITDYPGVPYRAIHLDIKYHLDAEHYYYQMIDRLARIKINAIIVEFEDKLRYITAPKVGAANAISIEEFAAISRYAKERNIEISPLVQGLGHVSFILKHDEYKYLRDDPASDRVFDPLNPETYKLQFALYEDAMKATPYGKYLHIGGDEVNNLGRSELAKKSGMKPLELQLYWLNKVCQFATEHNRIPIFWDDMLLVHAGLIETTAPNMSDEQTEKIWKENQHRLAENLSIFPKNCVYVRWDYSNPEVLGNVKAMEWYKSHNLKVMGAPAAQDMSAIMPRENSIFKPIQNFCRIATYYKLDGLICTLWDDSSPHFETFWRGLHYYASFSWNHEDIELAYAEMLFRHRFYAPELSDAAYEFQDQLEEALNFWDVALLDNGGRRSLRNFEIMSLPETIKPGEWSKKYNEKISRAQTEIERYLLIKGKIEKANKLARRNYYSLLLMNQINELQIYPSQLLLLIDKYDRAATAANKEKAGSELLGWINRFQDIRNSYEDVFSVTRFLKNPDGYILDQNLDFMLANCTNNSDWMYNFELKVNDLIKQMLTKR